MRVSRQTIVGFGCAGLYRLPRKRDRFAILERAYELGIRHFDVAPIYGLGVAEGELAEFKTRHADIQIATKFGIHPTRIGWAAGRVQPVVREVLRRFPMVQRQVKDSGDQPDSGVVGRVLYATDGLSQNAARRALDRSRTILRTERIDYFLLHEPAGLSGGYGYGYEALVDYLEVERANGGIGQWGLAGNLAEPKGAITQLSDRAGVLQFPYDLFAGYGGPVPDAHRTAITFGFIARSLPRVIEILRRRPALRQQCSDLVDSDLADRQVAIRLIVRDAVEHNPFGIVLVSSTNVDHLDTAYRAASAPLRNVRAAADLIRQAGHPAGPDQAGTA